MGALREARMGKAGLVPTHSAEPVHATKSPHATEATHTAAGEGAAVKARSDWRTEMAVIHLMEMVEVVKVMETIDKDQAHARADEKRRPPPPKVGIWIGRGGVPQHATVRALHDLPCPVRLQARTSGDLLHRAVYFCLSGDCAAIGAVGRHGQVVICLRECRPRKAQTDEQCPEAFRRADIAGVAQHIGVPGASSRRGDSCLPLGNVLA